MKTKFGTWRGSLSVTKQKVPVFLHRPAQTRRLKSGNLTRQKMSGQPSTQSMRVTPKPSGIWVGVHRAIFLQVEASMEPHVFGGRSSMQILDSLIFNAFNNYRIIKMRSRQSIGRWAVSLLVSTWLPAAGTRRYTFTKQKARKCSSMADKQTISSLNLQSVPFWAVTPKTSNSSNGIP